MRIGDIVRVKDTDFQYSEYSGFATFHGVGCKFEREKRLNTGDVGKIIKRGVHLEDCNAILLILQIKNRVYIIRQEGVELV